MFSVPGIGEWLRAQYKLSRSLGQQNIAVMHRFSDLSAAGDDGSRMAKLARGLIEDCQTFVLFRLEGDELKEAARILSLSDTERERVGNLQAGQALWKVGRAAPDRADRGLLDRDAARQHRQRDGRRPGRAAMNAVAAKLADGARARPARPSGRRGRARRSADLAGLRASASPHRSAKPGASTCSAETRAGVIALARSPPRRGERAGSQRARDGGRRACWRGGVVGAPDQWGDAGRGALAHLGARPRCAGARTAAARPGVANPVGPSRARAARAGDPGDRTVGRVDAVVARAGHRAPRGPARRQRPP